MSQGKSTYSISKVAEVTGVTKNRIRDWCLKGLLPEMEWIDVGKRRQRRFSDLHIDLIKAIDRLRGDGFELQMAVKKATQEISKN